LPADQRRSKGLVGGLIERALGAHAGSRSGPDFEALGIELKTVPLAPDGRPRESTYVCSLPLLRADEVEWDDCPVRRKLARVLWIPVESARHLALGSRRIGTPVLWSPDETEEARLRSDWDEIIGRIGTGRIEELTAHVGDVLQVRPKAATSRVQRRGQDSEGAWVLTVPRGFYLRAKFTGEVLRQALVSGTPDAAGAAQR
jgi:DNA mismatch repair protein MutH